MPTRQAAALALLLTGATLAPIPLQAQTGAPAWAPPQIGVRLGYDNKQQGQVLGAQLRLPVLPGGQVELMPNMDVTLLRGTKEYQYNIEAVFVWGGRSGALYGGGGLGFRDSFFGDGAGRRTELGYTTVIGFRLVGTALIVPQIEYRWVFIDEAPITYQQFSLGINFAFWAPVAR